jgi:phospholipase/carboxylesterase
MSTSPHTGQPVAAAGVPLGESDAVMIMVHGRNAGPRNILDLVPHFERPAWTYLAPAAANQTWYPHSFMAPIEQNEPWLSSALDALQQLVAGVIARGIRTDRIVLLGFSQGACLAAEFCARHPDRYGGVIIFSGGLVGPPGTTWSGEGRFDRTPVFLGCSDIDPHVPKPRVDESAAVFVRMGAEVTERIYPGMGHLVNDDEIAFARGVLDRIHNP